VPVLRVAFPGREGTMHMPYFITAFFRGFKNLFFRRYEPKTPQRSADQVYNDVMTDPNTWAPHNR
jgi:hypothetical protein